MKKLMFLAISAVLAAAPVFADKALLDQNYRRLAGKEVVNLQSAYAGQVLLVVNTASKCGFTPQYEALEAMHAKYKDQGFAVLGFPSNDFLGQEPGTEKQIQDFCTLTYGVKFPMFEKVHVKGSDATPFYKDLKAATGEAPAWNFHKYLIDRNGKVVASYGSRTKPDDPVLVAKLQALLAEPRPAH
ncbi:glutathione peroxidase [Arenimonas sp.]|uniref:glutathione peroxidase n=1 Tax=Arenimonas sp. TaxID=1872635 RepID=UPI0039C85DA7